MLKHGRPRSARTENNMEMNHLINAGLFPPPLPGWHLFACPKTCPKPRQFRTRPGPLRPGYGASALLRPARNGAAMPSQSAPRIHTIPNQSKLPDMRHMRLCEDISSAIGTRPGHAKGTERLYSEFFIIMFTLTPPSKKLRRTGEVYKYVFHIPAM